MKWTEVITQLLKKAEEVFPKAPDFRGTYTVGLVKDENGVEELRLFFTIGDKWFWSSFEDFDENDMQAWLLRNRAEIYEKYLNGDKGPA